MSDFDPVEIRLDLIQNVDSEGTKATKSVDEIAASSDKMKARMEKNMKSLEKVVADLGIKLKQLQELQAKQPSTSGDTKLIVEKQKLVDQIEKLNKKMLEQEAIIERLRVKNNQPGKSSIPGIPDSEAYAKANRNFNFSMQQIARELPNFAISPQIGIMAISNNLPILQDELRKTKAMNDALKASGQATVPVWKQVASSLFSTQTALIAGITIMMLYGKEISNWVSGLFRAKDALKLTKDEVNGLNESFAKAAGSDLGKLKTLFDSLNNAKKGTVEYYDAKKQIVDQYGNYLKGMDGEIASLNNVKGAYQALTVEIIKAAKAKALQETTSNLATDFLTKSGATYDNIQNNFIREFGEDLGKMRFDMFKSQLESGGDFSYEMQRYIAEFNTKRRDVVGTSTSGAVQYGSEYDFNAITKAISEYKKAKSEFDQKTKDAWDRFGNTSETAIKNTVAVIDERIQALKTEQKQVSDNKAKWDEYQKQIDQLETQKDQITGGKKKKEIDVVAAARENLEKAIKSGDQQAIDGASKVYEKLQREKDLMDAMAESALAIIKNLSTRGKGPTTVSDAIEEMKKATGLDFSAKTAGKFIDNISKLEGKNLDNVQRKQKQNAEFKKKTEKDSAEQLEEEARLREDIARYALQLVDALTAGLDLTEEQAAALNGAMNTIAQLGQGDYIGAAISGLTTAVTAIMDTSGIEEKLSRPWEEFEDWISRSNDALERYIKLRDEAIGGERYTTSDKAIQEAQAIKQDAEAKLNSMKLSWTFKDSGWGKSPYNNVYGAIDELEKKLGGGINLEGDQREWGIGGVWKRVKQVVSYDLSKMTKDAAGNFSLDKLRELIKNGTVADEAVVKAVADYDANMDKLVNLQKEKQQLLTATMASSIADSIIEGFKNGYDSAADFADNFEGLMEDAVLNAVKIKALEEPLKKWYDQFSLDMESGGGLDENEKSILKKWWDDIVAGGIAASSAALDAAGIDPDFNSERTGSVKGIAQASQDSVDENNGRLTAIQAYIYDIRNINQQSFDFEKEALAYDAAILSQLETIAENTDYCKYLENMDRVLSDIQLKGVKLKS